MPRRWGKVGEPTRKENMKSFSEEFRRKIVA